MSNPQKSTINGYFKSKYVDLNSVREAVIPALNANGITVLQNMVQADGKNSNHQIENLRIICPKRSSSNSSILEQEQKKL